MANLQPPAEDTTADQESGDRARVMRAAGLVGAALLLGRFVGLLREMVTRSSLGVTSVEATAYSIAKVFPEAIFFIIAGGAIGSAFIPTFAAYFARDDEEGGWRLFSAVINLVTVAVTVVAILMMIFAPAVVAFFYGDVIEQQADLLDMTVQLMRIMLLSTIVFGASGVIMGALNARQHFLLPALAPTIYNLGIIAGALLLGPGLGTAVGLAIGTVIGALGHLLIQIPGLFQVNARYKPILTVRDPGVRKVLYLMAPRVVGLSFSYINWFIILFMTGSMTLGSLPALETAFRLIVLPQGILGQAMGIAAFPTLSTLAARQAYDQMRMIISDSLRILIFLGLPVTILLITLGRPIIVILFERGLFDSESTDLVYYALTLMSLSLIALLLLEVIARSFYALSDTITPVLAGGVQVLLMYLLSIWLRDTVFAARGWLPLGALALGFSLSNYVEVAILLLLLRRKMGGLAGRDLLSGTWRMLVAGVLMALAIVLVTARFAPEAVWLQLIAGALVGGLIYILACWLLRVKEVRQFLDYGLGQLARFR